MRATAKTWFELPIRIQVPDGYSVELSREATVSLTFQDIQAPARADGMRGEGVDDGKGTYTRSRVAVSFDFDLLAPPPLTESDADMTAERMRSQAWHYLLSFVRQYSVVARHLESTLLVSPEKYGLELLDAKNGTLVPGFAQVSGHVLPGAIHLKPTLTAKGLAELAHLLDSQTPNLVEEILLRAEAHATLLDELDHAVLDTASALEIFIDQALDLLCNGAANAAKVRRAAAGGVYSKYDECLQLLGRPSLKDADRWKLQTGETIAFEVLEFIFVIRNNVVHKGLRAFTPESLNTRRYRSEYLSRHRDSGNVAITQAVVLSLIETARGIVRWIRENALSNAP